MRKNISAGSALSFLFLAAVFLLALNKVADTDAWMQLSLGKMVWLQKSASFTEPYVYPLFGTHFYNYSWFFALVYYLSYLSLGLYGVVTLKALCILAAFAILLKDSLRPYRNYVISVVVLSTVVILARHRFVERPDTFLMIFISFTIFSLNAYLYDGKKYLYCLPAVHVLWANSHTSLPLMVVPFLAFIGGGLIQRLGSKRGLPFEASPSSLQLRTITVVFLVSIVASFITPNFFHHFRDMGQFTSGPLVLTDAWSKLNIVELQRPVWPFDRLPFILPAVVLLSFFVNGRRLSLIHLFLVIPFLILPMTAKRFIFLLGITSGPVVVRNLSSFLETSSWKDFFSRPLPTAAAGGWIILYTTLALAQVGPFGNKNMVFGFGINAQAVPEAALQYMDRRGITGRIFNFFDWGGYVNWRDYPRRSVFMDPRAWLPMEILEKGDLHATKNPAVLDELENRYKFASLVLSYPPLVWSSLLDKSFQEKDLLVSHPEWALVYWDDIALVYVKRGGRYAPVINEDEYRFVKPANFAPFSIAKLHNDDYRKGVTKELLRNISETGSSRARAMLGLLYSEMGRWSEALDAYEKVSDVPGIDLAKVYAGMGDAAAGGGDYKKAVHYYREALERSGASSSLYYKLGLAHLNGGDKKTAVAYFEKALKLNPDLTSLYTILPGLYKKLGVSKTVNAGVPRPAGVSEAARLSRRGFAAYSAGRLDIAIADFEQAAKTNPGNPAYYSNIGYVAYDMGLLDMSYEYQMMAIEADPGFANAHYGLALVLKKWGEGKAARKHWVRYLQGEPTGKFAERAAEEIRALDAASVN